MFKMRGTLLNTGTVATGAIIGLAVGQHLEPNLQTIALHGIGLVVIGLGIKMFLESKNPLIAAASIAFGGVIGTILQFNTGMSKFAQFFQQIAGGQGHFAQGLVTSFVLFCIGPMTLLGCFEDGIENKIEILSLKSVMDGICSFFLAAATGAGVLVTAVLLLLFQGSLTILAKSLKSCAENKELVNEVTGVGGVILLATGIGMIGIKQLLTVNFLPALLLAPIIVLVQQKFQKRRFDRLQMKAHVEGREILNIQERNIAATVDVTENSV